MKARILDETHGQEASYSYDLEQWVQFGDDEALVCVTVHYDSSGYGTSSAEAVMIDIDETGGYTDIRVREFPSRWWHTIPAFDGEDTPVIPGAMLEPMQAVASALVVRMGNLLDPGKDDSED